MINSVASTIALLDQPATDPLQREMAAYYLEHHPDQTAIHRLVLALEDDDAGVRWTAAEALAGLGETALPEMLTALLDHERVGDPLLLEGIYHALYHTHSQKVALTTRHLLEALSGPVADLRSMEEAYKLLYQPPIRWRSADHPTR